MSVELYERMLLIRTFEEALTGLFKEGRLQGTTHCCTGQEAVAVGVINAITSDDIVVSNHRGHGHFLAYTDDVDGLMAEITGQREGVCEGRGGSQHLHSGNFYSNGITGGMVPVATGMAFAEKNQGSGRKVVAFLGDGALGQGVVYESWNMAALWSLPILFVVENNMYAMSAHIDAHLSGDIASRAQAFQIPAVENESNDAEEIHADAQQLIDAIARDGGPRVLICHTYRFSGHSKSDDLSYQPDDETRIWAEKDPLKLAGRRLEAHVRDDIAARVEQRVARATAAHI